MDTNNLMVPEKSIIKMISKPSSTGSILTTKSTSDYNDKIQRNGGAEGQIKR